MPQKDYLKPTLSIEEIDGYIKNSKNLLKKQMVDLARYRFDVVYPPQTKKPQLLKHFLHTAQWLRGQILSAQNRETPRSPR